MNIPQVAYPRPAIPNSQSNSCLGPIAIKVLVVPVLNSISRSPRHPLKILRVRQTLRPNPSRSNTTPENPTLTSKILGTEGAQCFSQTRNHDLQSQLLLGRQIRLLLFIRSGCSSNLLLLRAVLQKGMETADHQHDEHDGDRDDLDTDL